MDFIEYTSDQKWRLRVWETNQLNDLKRQFHQLQRATLSYLDSLLNEDAYRVDAGCNDIQIEELQGRRRWKLLETLRQQGCRIEQTPDGWMLRETAIAGICQHCLGEGCLYDWTDSSKETTIPCSACAGQGVTG